MARYYDDLSGILPLGVQPPTGWSPDSANVFWVGVDATLHGASGYAVQGTSSSSSAYAGTLYKQAAPLLPHDLSKPFQVYAPVRVRAVAPALWAKAEVGIALRTNGNGSVRTWAAMVRNDGLRAANPPNLAGGAQHAFTPSLGTLYHLLVDFQPAGRILRAMVWAGDVVADRPALWQVQYTILGAVGDSGTVLTDIGFYGVAEGSPQYDGTPYGPRRPTFYGYGLGTDGDAALTGPLPPDTPPTVAITRPADGSAHPVGAVVRFEATATDTEDGDLSSVLRWDSDRDGALGLGSALDIATLSAGLHTITARATDSAGQQGSDQVAIDVAAGLLVAAIIAPAHASRHVSGASITLSGLARYAGDPAPFTGALTWSSSRDGVLGVGTSLTLSSLSAGNHLITLTAADGEQVATDTIVITVVEEVAVVVPLAFVEESESLAFRWPP